MEFERLFARRLDKIKSRKYALENPISYGHEPAGEKQLGVYSKEIKNADRFFEAGNSERIS